MNIAGPRQFDSIAGIQYLRAVAALMVVGHHARHYFHEGESWTGFGSRGVDIFFVISGFIMAHATSTYRADAHRLRQTGDFLLKRFVRVVPLYWLALIWTAKKAVISGDAGTDLLKDIAFIPHFHAVYTDSIFPALVPGWTINYEVFFYLLFAVSMMFGRLRFAMLAASISGLVLLGIFPWSSAAAIFYTSSVILEFLLGIAVYAWWARRPTVARVHWPVATTLVGFALLAIDNGDKARGLFDGLCAALIVASTVVWAQGSKLHWLRKLGDASYSIYLFHLASFSIAATLLHMAGIESATPLHIAVAIGLHMAVAIAAGLAIHQFLERPLLALLRAFIKRPGRSPS